MSKEVLNEVSLRWTDREPNEDEIASFRGRAAEHFGEPVKVTVEENRGIDQVDGELVLYFLSARAAT